VELDAEAYRTLFDLNPRPILVNDQETQRFVAVNQAACEQYGWTREEFLAMTLSDLRPPDDRPAFQVVYEAAKLAGTPYWRQSRHLTKDGRVLDVTLQVSWVVLAGRPAAVAVVTDTTGIHQVERRFRLLVENSSDGISFNDVHNVPQYISPGGLKLLGYSSDDLIGKQPSLIIHPDDLGRWRSPKPGETFHSVGRFRHRDGSWRWLETATTNLTHDPAVRAFVSNFRDITERKTFEQRQEWLMSATLAVTYTARVYGDYGATYISANVNKVLGYDPEVFYRDGGFWYRNIHPDDVSLIDAALAEHPSELALQYRFRHADGTYRWMRDVGRVIREDPDKPEVVGYWIDVTDQVTAEASLRRSEASFRTLIERAQTATFVHRDGRYVYVNSAAIALLGHRSADAIVGHPVLDFIHPDDRDAIAKRILQLATTGGVAPGAVRMVRADGSVVVLEGEAVRVDFDGEPSIVVMGHDVTERDQMFARLALADRMLTVGTLAAGVGHEINNPLAYVTSSLELLAAELPSLRVAAGSRLNDASLRTLVSDACDGVSRVSTIVRDLRSLSRPEDEVRGPVDVAGVLAASVKMAHNELRHRARVIETYESVPPVAGDASRLGQVFLNLLLNAAQAIPEGHAEQNAITIRVGLASGGVRVDISDTGSGISPAIIGRIFDPFFTTKAPGIGTGLGLSISHQIVRSMDGEITVDSQAGRGCTFSVTLPVASTSRAAATPAAPPPRLQVRRILLIDDEAAVGRALEALLAPETEVVCEQRAGDALARLASGERFDVIVCDLMMPEISGIELYAHLADVAPDCRSRIIFMTGGAFTPDAREFLDRLDRPHLEKPFSELQLRHAIDGIFAAEVR
jgi:PAS domain S-box-containing protein